MTDDAEPSAEAMKAAALVCENHIDEPIGGYHGSLEVDIATAIDAAVGAETLRADKAETALTEMRRHLESGFGHFVGHDMTTLADTLEEVAGSIRSDAKHYDGIRAEILDTPTPPAADSK